VREYAIDLVLPGVEYDALRMSQERDRFAALSARFVLNSKTLIESDSDKWSTHCRQAVAGIPTIDTKVSGEFSELATALGIPFLVKPRRSSGSKGHHRISTALDYEQAQARLAGEFVAQRIVGTDDAEYTVGVFGYGDGTSSHFLALQRRLSREGSTVKAKTVFDAALERTVAELVALFKPEGPTNLQFRLHDGKYLLLEINPRFSSSGSLRAAFGINDVELCIEYYLKERRPAERQVRPGSAIRYIEDLVVYDSADI
jgi:carbamoyl-phosphate synthase large subunit